MVRKNGSFIPSINYASEVKKIHFILNRIKV